MEGHRNHRVSIAILALSMLAVPGLAAADEGNDPPLHQPPTIVVNSDPNQVVVDASTNVTTPGSTQPAGYHSGPSCYLKEVPGSDMTEDLTDEYWRRRMQDAPYYLICNQQIRGIVWIEIDLSSPSSGSSAAQSPRQVAMNLRDHLPIPFVSVRMNPDRGLAGAESWFWIQGYGGAPLSRSTDAFGSLVEVDARVTHYEWAFGDGSTLASDSTGQAYPARSEIRHLYERSSAGMPDGYSVDVTFAFAVRYRVDGGAWIELPSISRTAHADYPVRESQAVIGR